jgi:hypothetical protein
MDDKKLYHYWMNSIKRAKKAQPTDAWKRAENKLKVDDVGKQPYLSGYRLLYESMKSFLDQNTPQFDIQPTRAFMDNELANKYAECDSAMLDYIWAEQDVQTVQSTKLDSCLVRNVGFSLCGFDVKKWLPSCRYLNASSVGFDPDCDNQISLASWMHYEEPMSLEDFKSKYDLNEQDMMKVVKAAGSSLDEKEQEALPDGDDGSLYKTVLVYHIFARNDAAVRDTEGEEIPTDKQVESLELETPKRYLQYVEGLEKPIFDGPWPYELDDNEFPITPLRFNTLSEDLYGYTDNDHMNRIDGFCDNLMSDIEESSKWYSRKKFGSKKTDLTDTAIQDFLNNPKKTFLPGIIGTDGKPKISMLDIGGYEPGLMATYKQASDERRDASALGELLSTRASEYKDVTALAASIHDNNAHQRVNRRLGGPEGYEHSINADAIKLLEIAHQEIPRYSTLEIEVVDEESGETMKQLQSFPWAEAQQYLLQGAALIQLGADAIVGDELAQYWRTHEEFSPVLFKLSTQVSVRPGSTREATKDKKAAVMKQFYLEVLAPLYQGMGDWTHAIRYIENMGYYAGIENMADYLPVLEDAYAKEQQEAAIEEKQVADTLNAPDEREMMEREAQNAAL